MQRTKCLECQATTKLGHEDTEKGNTDHRKIPIETSLVLIHVDTNRGMYYRLYVHHLLYHCMQEFLYALRNHVAID